MGMGTFTICHAADEISDRGITGIPVLMADRLFLTAGKIRILLITGIGVGMTVRLLQSAGKNSLLLIAGV